MSVYNSITVNCVLFIIRFSLCSQKNSTTLMYPKSVCHMYFVKYIVLGSFSCNLMDITATIATVCLQNTKSFQKA